MKTYKFPKHINAVSGEPLADGDKPLNFHVILSNALCGMDDQKTGIDCGKAIEWARNIYKKGEVQMDESDKLAFAAWINTAGFSAIIKVELLKIFR